MRRTAAAILTGVLALGAAACSGDDDEPEVERTTTSAPAVPADLVRDVNRQCTILTGRLQVALEGTDPIAEPERYVDVVQENLLPVLREFVEVFDAIGDDVPDAIRDDYDAFVDGLDDGADLVESEPAVVLNAQVDPLEDFYARAADLGFTACSGE
jgi:hypothetical protein